MYHPCLFTPADGFSTLGLFDESSSAILHLPKLSNVCASVFRSSLRKKKKKKKREIQTRTLTRVFSKSATNFVSLECGVGANLYTQLLLQEVVIGVFPIVIVLSAMSTEIFQSIVNSL